MFKFKNPFKNLLKRKQNIITRPKKGTRVKAKRKPYLVKYQIILDGKPTNAFVEVEYLGWGRSHVLGEASQKVEFKAHSARKSR